MKLLAASSTILVAAFTTVKAERTFIPKCGDCWCAYGEGNTCPEFREGLNDFDSIDPKVPDAYLSFKLVSEPFTAKSQDGGECFPFKDATEPLDVYPESYLPQCVLPTPNTDEAVCAFKFKTAVAKDATPESCADREYEAITYESEESAEDDCAIITHKGACGSCSSANDLSVMLTRRTVDTDLAACAATYFFDTTNLATRFGNLVTCVVENTGFTDECSWIWAHHSAAAAHYCTNECLAFGLSTDQETNGPAPDCKFLECPQCPFDVGFQQLFNRMIGRQYEQSGLTQQYAVPCEDFYAVNHDPCHNGPCFTTTSAPTESAVPSVSPEPSITPTLSFAPSTSPEPSMTPSIDPATSGSTFLSSTRTGLFVSVVVAAVF